LTLHQFLISGFRVLCEHADNNINTIWCLARVLCFYVICFIADEADDHAVRRQPQRCTLISPSSSPPNEFDGLPANVDSRPGAGLRSFQIPDRKRACSLPVSSLNVAPKKWFRISPEKYFTLKVITVCCLFFDFAVITSST